MVNVYEFAPFGRPITRVKYNIAGDLCFVSSRSNQPIVWRTDTLEPFGEYIGHDGAVNDFDISSDSKFMLTAGSDYHSFIFDVETGKKLWNTEADGSITTCGIAKNRKSFFMTHFGASKSKLLTIYHDLNNPKEFKRLLLEDNEAETIRALWSPLDDSIILCQADGSIQFYDMKMQKLKQNIRAHTSAVNDFNISADGLFGISSSRDTTAKVWNMRDMSLMQVFKTPRCVNTADFSPTKPHVVLAGGVTASEITTTDIFEHLTQHRIFNYLTGVEFANIAGHAGPVNSLRYNPNGDSYLMHAMDLIDLFECRFASGAESGTIRFHILDDSVYNADKI